MKVFLLFGSGTQGIDFNVPFQVLKFRQSELIKEDRTDLQLLSPVHLVNEKKVLIVEK